MRNSHWTYNKNSFSFRINKFFERAFLEQKLNNWLGYFIFSLLAVGIGFLMVQKTEIALGMLGLVCGLAVAIVCMMNAELGLYIIMIYSFMVSHFNRLLFGDSLPVGVLQDILIGVTFLGFLVRKVNLRNSVNSFVKNTVVLMFLIVYGYMALEVVNPNAGSLTGWVPAFRKILGTLLILFISYNIFNTLEAIKRFIKVLFVMCVLVAIYACIQQFNGFFAFEYNWLLSDPRRFRMTFVNGGSRKMSFMPDSLSLSIVMATCSVLFITFFAFEKNAFKRVILGTGVMLMILAMTYSLTRTSNVMLVGGVGMFMLIMIDKKLTRIYALLGLGFFLILLYGPYSNAQIGQFRQTFKGGTKDASYLVREQNRKSIQPYIYSHPIGGGLSTTGGEGETYNPGHPLAGFPPDSGYLKKALEIGWIGLILIMSLYFFILREGIRGYFRSKNETIKLIYTGITASCFAFYVGDFSQVSIGQITDVVVYYPFIAILLGLKAIESKSKPLTPS